MSHIVSEHHITHNAIDCFGLGYVNNIEFDHTSKSFTIFLRESYLIRHKDLIDFCKLVNSHCQFIRERSWNFKLDEEYTYA